MDTTRVPLSTTLSTQRLPIYLRVKPQLYRRPTRTRTYLLRMTGSGVTDIIPEIMYMAAAMFITRQYHKADFILAYNGCIRADIEAVF